MFSICRIKLFFVIFVLFTFSAHAIGVSPTLLTIGPNEPIANLTVSNEGSVAVTMQLELVQWTQHKEEEIYNATEDLVATPQIFIIPPHGSQLIRVGLERPAYGNKEKAYRLFVQEVIPRKVLQKKNELKLALRLSLPVIIQSIAPVQQNLKWRLESQNEKKYTIVAENKGNNVVFINLLQGLTHSHKPVMKELTTFAYLLPGSTKHWIIKKTSSQKITSIKASVNSQTVFMNVA